MTTIFLTVREKSYNEQMGECQDEPDCFVLEWEMRV